jgi:ATP-binding cassette subfamily C protein
MQLRLISLAGNFIADVYRYRPRLMTVAAILMVGRSLSEGLSLALLVPLLNVVGVVPRTEGGRRLREALLAVFQGAHMTPSLEHVLAVFLAAVVLRAVLGYSTTLAAGCLEFGFLHHLRVRVYEALAHADWPHLVKMRQAHTTHGLTLQAEQVGWGVALLLNVIACCLTLLAGTVVALIASPALTMTVVAGGIALTASLLVFHWWTFARGAAAVRAMQHLYKVLGDRVDGLKLNKAFGIEAALAKDFTEASGAYQTSAIELRKTEGLMGVAQELTSVVLLIALVFAGVRLFEASNLELLLLIAIFSRLLPRAVELQTNIRQLVVVLPDYQGIRVSETAAQAAREPLPEPRVAIRLDRVLELREVSFRYAEQGGEEGLSQISFSLPAHTSLGVIGLSAAGKSTLADVIAGLVVPHRGEVLVDGRIIEGVTRLHWRAGIAYVDQESTIFHDTIRANICLGARQVSDEEIWRALKLTQIADLVEGLPERLGTLVGEGGVRLSRGERQRLRLASAILRRPQLIILDEAMSALNPVEELEVISSILHLLPQTTALAIAHRLTSVAWTDRLLVLQRGRVARYGPTAEILSGSLVPELRHIKGLIP